MKLQICVVRDRAIDQFGNPFFVTAIGQATRSFTDGVNSGKADDLVAQHPDDFDLYHLGEYDAGTARFLLLDSPVVVVRVGS